MKDYGREIEENVGSGKGKERATAEAQQKQPEQLVVYVQFLHVALVHE